MAEETERSARPLSLFSVRGVFARAEQQHREPRSSSRGLQSKTTIMAQEDTQVVFRCS